MVRSCIGSAGAAFKDFFLLSFFDPDPEGDPAIWKKQDEENRARRRGGGTAPGANYTTMTRKSRLYRCPCIITENKHVRSTGGGLETRAAPGQQLLITVAEN